MRVGLCIFWVLAVFWTVKANDVIDTDKLKKDTVMSGPINEKPLMPCGDECLCDAPKKSTAPIAKLVTLNEVVLGWKQPSDNIYCDVATQLQMRLEGSDSFQTIYNGPAREHTVHKIPLDINVSFRIRERNCAGTSAYSDELLIHTPPASAHPSAPTVTYQDQSSVCLKWDPYPETTITLNKRLVEMESSTPRPWDIVFQGNDSTQACAGNLTSYTYYQFRIVVDDEKLEEPISDSVLVRTNMTAPPTPMQPFEASVTDSSVTVRWNSTSSFNKSPSQIFIVEVAVVADVDDMDAESNKNTTLLFYRVSQVTKSISTIAGLSAGTAYAVRIRAVNSAGESAPSEALIVTTKPTVPGQPGPIVFEAVSGDSIKLQWGQARARGSPITAYEVSISPGAAVSDFYTVYQGPKTFARLSGLTQMTFYGVRVRAVNEVGTGDWTKQYNVKTAGSGKSLSPAELKAASVPIKSSRPSTQILTQASAEANSQYSHEEHKLMSGQAHLQLVSTMKPQLGQARNDPDSVSDDVSGRSIVVNEPSVPAEAVHVPPVQIDGSCDLKEGCQQKDATTKEVPICPNGCFSELGQGFCLPGGKCHCAFGWKGDDCNTALCTDIGEDCSGHGKCTAPNQCTCQPGFNSKDCSKVWTSVFYQSQVIDNPANISVVRNRALAGRNVSSTKSQEYEYSGSTILINQPVVVPTKPSPIHPRRRSLTPKPIPKISGSYVALPASKSFDFTANDTFTISMWVRATEVTKQQGGKLLSHGPHQHGPGYGLGFLAGGQVFCGLGSEADPFRASNLAVAVTQDSFADGNYHHVACRYRGNLRIINLLIDGNEVLLAQPFPYKGGKVTYSSELDASSLPEPAVSAVDYPLVIGANWDMQDQHFDGEIIDVRIWRAGKTYDEIRSGMWTPMTIAVPSMALYLPLTDCTHAKLTAFRWQEDEAGEGKPQLLKFDNTLTDCLLQRHPIAKPVTETSDVVL